MTTVVGKLRRSANGRAEQTARWLRDTKAKHSLWQVPGHFYSPIPLHPDALSESVFDRSDREIPGIELRAEGQVELLQELGEYYSRCNFNPMADPSSRYYTDNDQFPCGDAAGYTMMLNHLQPKRVLEIGSGYSTAVALDAREKSQKLDFSLTCIEPYPDRLHRLMREGDQVDLIGQNLEDVPLDTFGNLEAGDILFVDSTHVVKLGSDVNQLFARILPALPEGIHIHIHDIQWPFEYPRSWAEQGRAWNEAYVLRSFLQFNHEFSISFWANYLWATRPDLFAHMPYFAQDEGSGIWLTRLKVA